MRIWQLGKVLKNTNEVRWPSGEAHLLRDPSEACRRGAKGGTHRLCFDLVLKRQGCEEPKVRSQKRVCSVAERFSREAGNTCSGRSRYTATSPTLCTEVLKYWIQCEPTLGRGTQLSSAVCSRTNFNVNDAGRTSQSISLSEEVCENTAATCADLNPLSPRLPLHSFTVKSLRKLSDGSQSQKKC